MNFNKKIHFIEHTSLNKWFLKVFPYDDSPWIKCLEFVSKPGKVLFKKKLSTPAYMNIQHYVKLYSSVFDYILNK